MTRVQVSTSSRTYEALVGSGLLRNFASLLPDKLSERHCAIVCDTNSRRFASTIALARSELIEIPAGEQSKSLEQVGAICDRMIAAGLDRSSFVVAVGGGVIGDISGFVAAIFQRGVPHVQVPKTLLAMVDSAIGGKNGVNARAGKNLIGTIYQPALVVADPETLRTLPEHEFRQGLAEIVKHGVIAHAAMLDELATFDRDRDLEPLIARNIEIKARIIAQDEREHRDRALLNFGHTIGHAIERAVGYGAISHGDAVSIGMAGACEISVKRAGLTSNDRDRVVSLLKQLGLPTSLPSGVSRNAILDAVQVDKKFRDREVRFVVTPRLGTAYVSSDVTLDDIRNVVARL